MGTVAWSGLPEGNGQCRCCLNLLTANTSHQAQASPHAISRPYQIWSNIQRLRIWEFLERVQLLAIHGTRPRQCLREEVGYLVGIVGYCLANAGCLG